MGNLLRLLSHSLPAIRLPRVLEPYAADLCQRAMPQRFGGRPQDPVLIQEGSTPSVRRYECAVTVVVKPVASGSPSNRLQVRILSHTLSFTLETLMGTFAPSRQDETPRLS